MSLGVRAFKSPAEVVENCDLVVISVKPYLVGEVLPRSRGLARRRSSPSPPAFCSEFYEDLLGEGSRHLSTIPNTPIAIGKGVISCEERHTLDVDEWETFVGLFSPIALIEVLPGHLLSVASALAGCGPAFAAMFLEALADGGVKNGLPRQTAYRLAAQMMAGTAELHLATGTHPGAMKDAVCSPGGTTIKGVAALENAGMRRSCCEGASTPRFRKGVRAPHHF